MGNAHQVFQWVFTSPRLQVQMFLTRSIKQAEALLPGNSARLGLSWQAQPPGEPGRAAWVHLPRRWPSPSPRQTEPPPTPTRYSNQRPGPGPVSCLLWLPGRMREFPGLRRIQKSQGQPLPSSLCSLEVLRAGAGEDMGDSVQHQAPAELPGRRLSLSLAGKGLFTGSA